MQSELFAGCIRDGIVVRVVGRGQCRRAPFSASWSRPGSIVDQACLMPLTADIWTTHFSVV